MNRITWDSDMLSRLHHLRGEGVPLLECCEEIGVSYPTMCRKAQEIGVSGRMNRGRSTGRQLAAVAVRACRVCGCTQDDCSGCIARTGEPCAWVGIDLCSACSEGVLICVAS